MYICLGLTSKVINFTENVTIYRIYDTETGMYTDLDYDTVYNMLKNNIPIGNICIKRRKITGDNIDLIWLTYTEYRIAYIILGYIKDEHNNTIGYDLIRQDGIKECCNYEQALHMVESRLIANASIANGRVRVSCTTGLSTRTLDTEKFKKKVEKDTKVRKERARRERIEFGQKMDKLNGWEPTPTEEYDKERERIDKRAKEANKKDKEKKKNKEDKGGEHHKSKKKNKQQEQLVSSMLREYSKPQPFQTERALMKIFKR